MIFWPEFHIIVFVFVPWFLLSFQCCVSYSGMGVNIIEHLKSFQKVDEIFELFFKKNKWRLAEIVAELGYPKGTVHNILSAMVEKGYLIREGNYYILGNRVLQLSGLMRHNMEFRELALPYLEELRNSINETVHLTSLFRDKVIYIECIHPTHALRPHSTVGITASLYCTGVGKALLAFQPDEYIESYLNKTELVKRTENTITDKNAMKKELEWIREHGYAYDRIEQEESIKCIAAPVLDSLGIAKYAISIAGPADRMADSTIEDYKPFFFKTLSKITRILRDYEI